MTQETELTRAPSFEERMTERVRKEIGDMLTTEELRAMVDKTINKLLFEPKTVVERNGWQDKQKIIPPLIETITREVMGEQMKQAVREWLADNDELVKKAVDEVIKDGAGKAFVKGLDSAFARSMENFQTSIITQLEEMRNQ